MTNTLLSWVYLAVNIFAAPAFAAGTLPDSLAKQLEKEKPGAKVLESQSCKIGAGGHPSYGILLQLKSKEENPLQEIVAVETGKGAFELTALPHAVSYIHGSTPDVLAEYWTDGKYSGPLSIRCANPTSDAEISPKINGAFLKGFASKQDRNTTHLCFASGMTYNEWVCASIRAKGKKPELSFVQMNAD